MQYLVIRFIVDIFLNYLRTAVCFEYLFFTILPGHILYMECPFVHSYGIPYKAQLSNKSMRTYAVLFLNNRLNAPLNLEEIWKLLYAFSLEIHPF